LQTHNRKTEYYSKANAEYAENKFVEAEANYRFRSFPKSNCTFNLGNTIYKQNNLPKEIAYAKSLKIQNTTAKHRAFHNLGNVFMNEKDYASS
jgi:hypothetical protein